MLDKALNLLPIGFQLNNEAPADNCVVEGFIEQYFAYSRQSAAQTLRSAKALAFPHSFIITKDKLIVALIRAWWVKLTPTDTAAKILWIGPLIVHPSYRSLGLGSILMRTLIKSAEADNVSALFLLGDCEYYSRFGFDSKLAANIEIDGQVGNYIAQRLQILPIISGVTGIDKQILSRLD